MSVKAYSLQNLEQELLWVAESIKEELALDSSKTIAVIARKHKNLELIAKVLHENGIPVRYERKEDVLKQKHIQWLISILKFTLFYQKNRFEEAQSLLPNILAYPFWELPKLVIYDISLQAYKLRETSSWLKIMLDYKPEAIEVETLIIERVKNIANFLINLAVDSPNYSLGEICDWILGVDQDGEYKTKFEDKKLETTPPEAYYDYTQEEI